MALHYSTRKKIFKSIEAGEAGEAGEGAEGGDAGAGAAGLRPEDVQRHYHTHPHVTVTRTGARLEMEVGFDDRFDVSFAEDGAAELRSPWRLRLRLRSLQRIDQLVDRVLAAQREVAQRHQQRDKLRALQRRFLESQLRLQFQELPVPLAIHFPPGGVQLVFHMGPRTLSFWLPMQKGQTALPCSLDGVAELVRAAQALADRPVVFHMPPP